MSTSELNKGSLSNAEIVSNLEVLSSQLKALDIDLSAPENSILRGNGEFDKIESRLKSANFGKEHEKTSTTPKTGESSNQALKIAALEQRIRQLESVLGPDDNKEKSLFKLTRAENLTDAVEVVSSWVSLFKPTYIERVSREVNYLVQKLEKIDEAPVEANVDSQKKAKIDNLCDMVTSTDRYRALVPNIMQRMLALEEVQKKGKYKDKFSSVIISCVNRNLIHTIFVHFIIYIHIDIFFFSNSVGSSINYDTT